MRKDPAMPLCVFCPSELDATTNPEHILLNALGGRMATKSAICSTCNNRFGGKIDDALASSVTPIRNFFHLKSGSGDEAPTLKGVQAGAQKINVKGDGRLELVDKPFTVEDLGDGRWNLQISLDGANFEEELRRLMPHIAAKLKVTEDQLRQQLSGAQPSLISHRPDTAGHMLALGGPDVLRSIVKASLVLWSTLVGNDEVRGEHYGPARCFVVEGDESFNLNHGRLDSRIFNDVEKMKAEFGPLFNFIYVRSNDVGRVIGHFTLYNMVAWQFVLAESGGTPSVKIALISNPEEPSRRSNCAADEFDIPFAWLGTPDYSLEQAKARMGNMIKYYYDSNLETPVHLIMEECCKTLGIAPDEPLSAEKAEELKMLMTYRLGHYGLGLPYVEVITAERFAEILQK
jgi:hypothetical protein